MHMNQRDFRALWRAFLIFEFDLEVYLEVTIVLPVVRTIALSLLDKIFPGS